MEGVDIEKINELRKARLDMITAVDRWEKLTANLQNGSLDMRDAYSRMKPMVGDRPRGMKRRAALMALLYLFSPQSLIGLKTKANVRSILSAILSYGSPSSVSNEARDLLFLYRNYRTFREQVDSLVRIASSPAVMETCPTVIPPSSR